MATLNEQVQQELLMIDLMAKTLDFVESRLRRDLQPEPVKVDDAD